VRTKIKDVFRRSKSSILYFSIACSKCLRLRFQELGQFVKWDRPRVFAGKITGHGVRVLRADAGTWAALSFAEVLSLVSMVNHPGFY